MTRNGGQQIAHDMRALGSKQLFADLVGLNGLAKRSHDPLRLCRTRHIQSYNQALARVVSLQLSLPGPVRQLCCQVPHRPLLIVFRQLQ